MTVVVEGQQSTHELVIITGMSGAGKTVAIQSFEDLGITVLIIYHLRYLQLF